MLLHIFPSLLPNSYQSVEQLISLRNSSEAVYVIILVCVCSADLDAWSEL